VLKHLIYFVKGLMGKTISDMESSNPKALIQLEKENLQKKIIKMNSGLADQAAMIDRSKRHLTSLEKHEKEMALRINVQLSAGKRDAAAHEALQLKELKNQIEDAQTKLEAVDRTYKESIISRDRFIKEANAKIEKLKRMVTETELIEGQAELQEMVSGAESLACNSSDTLNRLESALLERKNQAKAKISLAEETPSQESEFTETEERQMLAEQALAEFETDRNPPVSEEALDFEPEKSLKPPRRKLGPVEDTE